MRSAIAVAAALLATPGPARAAEPERPKPPACKGGVLSDPRADVRNEGLDLVSAFLSVREGKVYANLMVARLDGEIDEPKATEEYYFVTYTDGRKRSRTVQARLYANRSRGGATWFDGRDGIVQVALPKLTPKTPTVLSAKSGSSQGSRHVAVWMPAFKQEVGFGGSFDINPVDADALHEQETVLCPPKPLPLAPGGAPQKTERSAAVTTAGTPRVRGRTLRVPLRSRTRVSDLRGRLTRGGRVVARGRLAELHGRGTLVLTARRPLRPGAYVLTIPGVLEQRLRIG